MAIIEQRLAAMGLELPEPLKVREGLRMPFAWVRVRSTAPTYRVTSSATGMGHWRNPSARSGPRFRLSRVTRQRGSLPWLISRASSGQSETSGYGVAARLRHGECCSGFQ